MAVRDGWLRNNDAARLADRSHDVLDSLPVHDLEQALPVEVAVEEAAKCKVSDSVLCRRLPVLCHRLFQCGPCCALCPTNLCFASESPSLLRPFLPTLSLCNLRISGLAYAFVHPV